MHTHIASKQTANNYLIAIASHLYICSIRAHTHRIISYLASYVHPYSYNTFSNTSTKLILTLATMIMQSQWGLNISVDVPENVMYLCVHIRSSRHVASYLYRCITKFVYLAIK